MSKVDVFPVIEGCAGPAGTSGGGVAIVCVNDKSSRNPKVKKNSEYNHSELFKLTIATFLVLRITY